MKTVCPRDCPKRSVTCRKDCPNWAAHEAAKVKEYAKREEWMRFRNYRVDSVRRTQKGWPRTKFPRGGEE